jgi:hypothetical protein
MAPSPEDGARSHHELPHLEATPEAAEADVLVRGHASRIDVAVLGVRQFLVKALARIRELRPRNLNLSWVTESLAVGGAFRPRDVRRLRAQGVTAVLDLREEATDDAELLARHGIQFLRLPTPDAHPPSQPDFERGVEWVLDQQSAGHKVFVH